MNRRRGMTLLELVIALVVGGTALAMGGASFAVLADRRATLIAEAEQAERAVNARRLLSAWLAEAANATLASEFVAVRGTRRASSGPLADDTMTFATTADGVAQRVRLFIDRRSDRPAFVAVIRAADGSEWTTILAPDVIGFEASFLTSAYGRREWRRGWARSALIPEAVALRLRTADGAQRPAALAGVITIPLAGAQ